MSENSENIEAKLCAYVEGDLDEAGRVEIERHLEAHPNHRRLIKELMATRDLLRFLPRESAPPELAEMFNSHLERAALLDAPAGDSAGPSLRGNLMPRLMAMAAVLLLGIGLVAIVYYSLPHGTSGPELAMPQPDASPRLAVPSTSSTSVGGSSSNVFAKGGPSDGGGGGATAVDARRPEAVATLGSGSRNDKVGKSVAGTISLNNGTASDDGHPAVYVFVCADNTRDAVREVTSNLTSNSISWRPLDESPPAASQPVQSQQNFTDLDLIPSTRAARELQVANARNAQQQQQLQQVQSQQVQQAPQVRSEPTQALGQTIADDAAANHVQRQEAQEPSKATELSVALEPKKDGSLAAVHGQGSATTEPAGEVVGIKAVMTQRQIEEFSRAVNRSSQQVKVFADAENLQSANALLEQDRSAGQLKVAEVESQQPAAPSGVANAAKTTGPTTRPSDFVAQSDTSEAPLAATVRAGSQQRASRAGKPSAINMKIGPRPTTEPAGDKYAAATAAPTTAAPEASAAPAPQLSKSDGVSMRYGSGPRTDVIRRGSRLSITVDELASPDTDKTATAVVDADGCVRLSKLTEAVRVVGLTKEQAETAISDAYVTAKVLDSAKCTVEKLADAATPTTRPTTLPSVLPTNLAQTAVRERTAGTMPATTQSSEPDEPVDVLILVQRNSVSSAGAASQPTINSSTPSPSPINAKQ